MGHKSSAASDKGQLEACFRKKALLLWVGVVLFLIRTGHRFPSFPLAVDGPGTTSTCHLWSQKGVGPWNWNHPCVVQISRIYQNRSDPSEWCIPPSHRPNIFWKRPGMIDETKDEPVVGILFMKNTKAASSTGAGVTLRIAERVGRRLLLRPLDDTLASTSCVRNWTHAFANHRGHSHRHLRRSLLWTILRRPAQRDVSAFYFFEHARLGRAATEEAIVAYLRAQKGGQFRYLHSHYIADDNNQPAFQEWLQTNNLTRVLQNLLLSYDFIALVERWEESLAVMTLLWNLQPSDVIVLSAKTSGGYDDGKFRNQCHKIPKPRLSATMQAYLDSDYYLQGNLDHVLYAAANVSLDRTIRELGADRVRDRVDILRTLQRRAEDACQTVAVFPCSSTGVLQRAAAQRSCYMDDSGCGHECVDQVVME